MSQSIALEAGAVIAMPALVIGVLVGSCSAMTSEAQEVWNLILSGGREGLEAVARPALQGAATRRLTKSHTACDV